MSKKIVQLNEAVIKSELKELVRGSVEENLNELLEAEAEKLTQAARYERNEQSQGYRSGYYSRNLTINFGDVALKVLKLKGISFETGSQDAQGDPRSREQEDCPRKSQGCGGGAALHEAERGRQEGRRQRGRNTDLL